jgi:hypothetical protein
MGNYLSNSRLFKKKESILFANNSLLIPLTDESNIMERIDNLEHNVKLLSEDIHILNNHLLNHQSSSK